MLKTISLPALSSSSSSPPTPTGRYHTPYPLIPPGEEGGRAGGKEVAMLHREAARREKMEMMGAFRLAATAYHRHSSAAGRISVDIGSVRVCKREARRRNFWVHGAVQVVKNVRHSLNVGSVQLKVCFLRNTVVPLHERYVNYLRSIMPMAPRSPLTTSFLLILRLPIPPVTRLLNLALSLWHVFANRSGLRVWVRAPTAHATLSR